VFRGRASQAGGRIRQSRPPDRRGQRLPREGSGARLLAADTEFRQEARKLAYTICVAPFGRRRTSLLLLPLLALLACKHPSGPPCTTPIPSTLLYEVYCDVVNRVYCLSPQYEDI
jgi:hypothetical protein